ncbi:hypothetical protein IVB38_03565, partial [Bradyrhizobium sp. 38]|uniref:hypothetical protein n=1 Tax=Bradyrhizobium sp. 38 TaxID=2782672 RepID=UPI00321192E4|nr:hypothetical protein [Bradyrhizobium sp. 38]
MDKRFLHGRGDDCGERRRAERTVADYFRCFAKLSEGTSNVGDESIVVVDDPNPNAPKLSGCIKRSLRLRQRLLITGAMDDHPAQISIAALAYP